MELRSEAQMDLILDLDDKSKLKAVVIYEDGSTGRRAKHFYDKLTHALEDQCAFSLQLWSFQVLAIPEFGESAAEAAGQADLVRLSLHGKAGLPAGVREWIEIWSRQIFDSDPALIALVHKPTTRGSRNASTLAYLRGLAKRIGVDFFGHTVFSLDKNSKGTHYEHRIDRKQEASKRRNPIAVSRPDRRYSFGRVRRGQPLRRSYTVR